MGLVRTRRTCPNQPHLLSRAFITTFIVGFRASKGSLATEAPSVALFTSTGCLYGNGAKKKLCNNQENTLFSFKRLLACGYIDDRTKDVVNSTWYKVINEGDQHRDSGQIFEKGNDFLNH